MLRFLPTYKSAPWGGRAIAEQLGRTGIPDGPVGESWELASFEDYDSRVQRGHLEGKSLSELWPTGALGGSAQGPFPFLLKWINATDFLSVQVHPDEETCARLDEGAPKSEAWLIVDKGEESAILAGHYPGLDGTTLKLAAEGGTVRKWLYEMRPRVGDMIPIEPGTLHSIGPGYLLLEVQQPSATTYRVYDWGRMGLDGKPRELHLPQAVETVDFKRSGPPKSRRDRVSGPCFDMRIVQAGARVEAGPLR
ncbi:MAG: type I phosphomannose isomerase catalytic subunit, partial [Myxococcota bacterium]